MEAHWIHLRYGIDKGLKIMEFDSRHFTLARDVLEKVKFKYKTCSINLFTEDGRQMKLDEVIEKARVYIIKRMPQR